MQSTETHHLQHCLDPSCLLHEQGPPLALLVVLVVRRPQCLQSLCSHKTHFQHNLRGLYSICSTASPGVQRFACFAILRATFKEMPATSADDLIKMSNRVQTSSEVKNEKTYLAMVAQQYQQFAVSCLLVLLHGTQGCIRLDLCP